MISAIERQRLAIKRAQSLLTASHLVSIIATKCQSTTKLNLMTIWRPNFSHKLFRVAKKSSTKTVITEIHLLLRASIRQSFSTLWTKSDAAVVNWLTKAIVQTQTRWVSYSPKKLIWEALARTNTTPKTTYTRFPGKRTEFAMSWTLATRNTVMKWTSKQTRNSGPYK